MIAKLIEIFTSLHIPYFEGFFDDGHIRAYVLPNGQVVEITLD